MIKHMLVLFALVTGLMGFSYGAYQDDTASSEIQEIQRAARTAISLAQCLDAAWYERCLSHSNPHLQPQHRIDRVLASLSIIEEPLHYEVLAHSMKKPENHQHHLEQNNADLKRNLAIDLIVYRNLCKKQTVATDLPLEQQIEAFLSDPKQLKTLPVTLKNCFKFKPAQESLARVFEVSEEEISNELFKIFENHHHDLKSELTDISDAEDDEPKASCSQPPMLKRTTIKNSLKKRVSSQPQKSSQTLSSAAAEASSSAPRKAPIPTPRSKPTQEPSGNPQASPKKSAPVGMHTEDLTALPYAPQPGAAPASSTVQAAKPAIAPKPKVLTSNSKGLLLPAPVARTTIAKRIAPQNAAAQTAPFFLPHPSVQERHPGTTVSSQKASEKSAVPSEGAVRRLKEFFERT